MKKCIFILSLILFPLSWVFSQPQGSSGYITELYFDNNDNWTLEIYFTYFDTQDTGYLLVSPTDTSFFRKFPDPNNFVVITQADLEGAFNIHRSGDSLGIINPMHILYNYGELTEDSFIWGNYDYFEFPNVNAPGPGQSIVRLKNFGDGEHSESNKSMVIDTVHSPGFFTRPPFGSIEGYVYDSTGVPLPNSEIMLTGFTVYLKGISIWTDQNGYFRDTALYAKNYSVIVNGLWLPFEESITIEPGGNLYKEFSVPLKRDVIVEGTCTLDDGENPAGTMVIFDNRCPGIAPDTVYTDDAGYFIYPAKTGSYYLWYSHAGYLPHPYYITLDLIHSLVIENQTLATGYAHEIPPGTVSGVWENDHPYWILGDIALEEGDTLTIQSGVNLNFIDECAFNIYGTLIAEGNAENIITIQQYSLYSYNGFQFLGENSSASRLQYISFGTETSLSFFNSSPAIDHALLFQTGFSSVGIYHSSAPIITNSSTSDTRFTIGDSASPVFRNNFFSGAVFTCRGHASPQFEYNDFYQSYLRAVECYDYTKPRFTGNIFFIGETGIYVYDEYGIDSVKYNSFFGLYSPGYNLGFPGICELDTININSDSCDYYFNITKHPRLVDPENGDFHLLENSPCIDAGDPASPMDPDSTIADIGAIYFNQLAIFIETVPDEPTIVRTYPNPASGRITFDIKLPEEYLNSSGFIHFYQLNGRKVRSYPLSINNSQGTDLQIYDLDLHSGTYIYRFELKDEEISSGKIIIINP